MVVADRLPLAVAVLAGLSMGVASCQARVAAPTELGAVASSGSPASEYLLTVVPSQSCANAGIGMRFPAEFKLQFHLGTATANDFEFVLPSGPDFTGPSSGTMTLRLSVQAGAVTGTLSGHALSADGFDTISIAASGPPLKGEAALDGSGALGFGSVSGTLAGVLDTSIYRTSAGGECSSAEHTWRLTPN